MSDYVVNGNPVSNRQDWRTVIVPGPVMSRIERHFPGVAQRFVTKGDTLGPDFIIEGFVESENADHDAALKGLMELEDLWNEYKATGPHTVTYATKTWQNMELLQFGAADPRVRGGKAPGAATYKLRRWCRWHWRQLSR